MNNIIEITSLRKSYGEIKAVNDVSLSVRTGEMFGLVGPDGAGKTTMIRILCGLISQESGNVKILDKNLGQSRKETQKNIGYLSQRFSLYGDLSVDENIEFFAEIHNVKDYFKRRDELLDFSRLKPFRNRTAEKLSGGMKQKLALVCSLIHEPKILFLDEPTTGVDPVSRRDFWKILSKLLKEGITIFMSTPYLDEAERCNRVALMSSGKIIALDTPKKIKEKMDKQIIEIVCSPVRVAYQTIKRNTALEVQMFGDRINVVVENYKSELASIKKLLVENKVQIADERIITPTLENVFMHLIKDA
ncbi:MAG: ABC transporter ATP-binding protein [Ignavibacteriales bacterium]|nr:ABC transporter ATP-binding protein [Ignavibacteriales bacterium]